MASGGSEEEWELVRGRVRAGRAQEVQRIVSRLLMAVAVCLSKEKLRDVSQRYEPAACPGSKVYDI